MLKLSSRWQPQFATLLLIILCFLQIDLTVQANCVNCQQGTFANTSCSTTFSCEPGMCPSTDICTLCTKGNYCPNEGMSNQTSCGLGYFCPTNGMRSPLKCPPKFYCSTINTIYPVLCPKDHYCKEECTVSPKRCPLGFISSPGQIDCAPGSKFYGIVVGSLVLSFFIIAIGLSIIRKVWLSKQDQSMYISTDQINLTTTIDQKSRLTNYVDTYNGF